MCQVWSGWWWLSTTSVTSPGCTPVSVNGPRIRPGSRTMPGSTTTTAAPSRTSTTLDATPSSVAYPACSTVSSAAMTRECSSVVVREEEVDVVVTDGDRGGVVEPDVDLLVGLDGRVAADRDREHADPRPLRIGEGPRPEGLVVDAGCRVAVGADQRGRQRDAGEVDGIHGGAGLD